MVFFPANLSILCTRIDRHNARHRSGVTMNLFLGTSAERDGNRALFHKVYIEYYARSKSILCPPDPRCSQDGRPSRNVNDFPKAETSPGFECKKGIKYVRIEWFGVLLFASLSTCQTDKPLDGITDRGEPGDCSAGGAGGLSLGLPPTEQTHGTKNMSALGTVSHAMRNSSFASG